MEYNVDKMSDLGKMTRVEISFQRNFDDLSIDMWEKRRMTGLTVYYYYLFPGKQVINTMQ